MIMFNLFQSVCLFICLSSSVVSIIEKYHNINQQQFIFQIVAYIDGAYYITYSIG